MRGPEGYRITAIVDGLPVETLADIAPQRDGLLFVGLSPSPESVAAGHYHRDALGRRFWSRLAEARIIPVGTEPELADEALEAAGHGLTDLLKVPTSRETTDELTLRRGVAPLFQRVALWRPQAVVFICKRAAEASAGRPLTEPWGQLAGVALGGRPCFLMPGTDAPREEVDEGLNFLRNLATAARAAGG